MSLALALGTAPGGVCPLQRALALFSTSARTQEHINSVEVLTTRRGGHTWAAFISMARCRMVVPARLAVARFFSVSAISLTGICLD